MTTTEQITNYIDSQPEPKRSEMQVLHELMHREAPAGKLWFNDGKNAEGKIVSNPNIGYGCYIITYADGKTKEFFQIGLSANKTGISVYILGLDDKKFLSKTFGQTIGKASVTGYCIKFRTIQDIKMEILEAAIRYGFTANNGRQRAD